MITEVLDITHTCLLLSERWAWTVLQSAHAAILRQVARRLPASATATRQQRDDLRAEAIRARKFCELRND